MRTILKHGIIQRAKFIGLTDFEDSPTQQHAKEETDINVIVKRWTKTGIPPVPKYNTSGFDNFTGVIDYHTAMTQITQAREMFMDLPSSVRNRFANDPQRLLEFVRNPANNEEMIKLGLAKAKESTTAPIKQELAPDNVTTKKVTTQQETKEKKE